MNEIAEIRKQDYEVAVSGEAKNLAVLHDFPDLVRRGLLLVTDNGSDYLLPELDAECRPKRSASGAYCYAEVLLGVDGVARHWHHMHPVRATPLIARIGLRPCRKMGDICETPLYRTTDVRDRMTAYLGKSGIDADAAALELGITKASFDGIRRGLLYDECGRYCQDLLEAFRDCHLPGGKTWGSRTSLVKDFIDRVNRDTGATPTMQNCEIPGCTSVADDRCVNPQCNGGRPRFICLSHGKWVESDQPCHLRPRSLCSICQKDASVQHRFPRFGHPDAGAPS